jgi:hypothetical protein
VRARVGQGVSPYADLDCEMYCCLPGSDVAGSRIRSGFLGGRDGDADPQGDNMVSGDDHVLLEWHAVLVGAAERDAAHRVSFDRPTLCCAQGCECDRDAVQVDAVRQHCDLERVEFAWMCAS